jgi:CheY-like chemotaxis protein
MADRKILYVDDEAPLRDLVRTFLEVEGYVVSTASDGQEAVTLLGREEFDIVLLDYHMPGMNGPEVLKHIRDHGLRARTILMSGDDGPAVRKAREEYHVDDCLSKPFDFNVLLGMLRVLSPPPRRAAAEENSSPR